MLLIKFSNHECLKVAGVECSSETPHHSLCEPTWAQLSFSQHKQGISINSIVLKSVEGWVATPCFLRSDYQLGGGSLQVNFQTKGGRFRINGFTKHAYMIPCGWVLSLADSNELARRSVIFLQWWEPTVSWPLQSCQMRPERIQLISTFQICFESLCGIM